MKGNSQGDGEEEGRCRTRDFMNAGSESARKALRGEEGLGRTVCPPSRLPTT